MMNDLDTKFNKKKKFDYNYDLIVMLIIVLLQLIKFFMLCCFKQCVNFTISVIWILIEVVIVLGLAISTLEGTVIASAPMLSLGLSFMLMVWPLLTAHLTFISHHLTEKEFHARLEVMNRLQISDAMIKSNGCGQRCTNLWRFFFKRKIPPSEILV